MIITLLKLPQSMACRQGFRVGDIDTRASESFRIERLHKRVQVVHAAATDRDEVRVRLQQLKLLSPIILWLISVSGADTNTTSAKGSTSSSWSGLT